VSDSPKDKVPFDDDFRVWWIIHQIRHVLLAARDQELKSSGISMAQAGILMAVKGIGEEATPSEISRWLFRKPHTISGSLAVMERDGLIKQTKDLQQKNMVRVSLTAKGEKAFQKSLKRESINFILASLSEDERKQLKVYLEKILNNGLLWLGQHNANPAPPFL
jgi:DNA-binding MarR family transcriptional regulator